MPDLLTLFFQDIAQTPVIVGKDTYLPLTRRIHRGLLLKRIAGRSPEETFQKILIRQIKNIEAFNEQCRARKLPELDNGKLSSEIEAFFDDPQQSIPPTLARSFGKRHMNEDEDTLKFEDLGWRCFYLLALFPPALRTLDRKLTYTPALGDHFRNLYSESQRSKKTLIDGTLRYPINIARLYINDAIPYLELVHEGVIGLMHAADKYDERRGHFQSYAGNWIKQRITRYIADQSRVIRIPVHVSDKMRQLKPTYDRLRNESAKDFDEWQFLQEVDWLSANDVAVLRRQPTIVELSPNEIVLKRRIRQYEHIAQHSPAHTPEAGARSSNPSGGREEADEDPQETEDAVALDIFEKFVSNGWLQADERPLFERIARLIESENDERVAIKTERAQVEPRLRKALRKVDLFYMCVKPIYSLERTVIQTHQRGNRRWKSFDDVAVATDATDDLEQLEFPFSQLEDALRLLTPRDYQIIVARYGLDGTGVKTLEEVGQTLGVTRERVRQIESRILDNLRRKKYSLSLPDVEVSLELDRVSNVSTRLQKHLRAQIDTKEAAYDDSALRTKREIQQIEALIERYIPSGRARSWSTNRQSGRADLFRDILIESGAPMHYGDIHTKAMQLVPEGMIFAKTATYTTLFYHRYFRSFGNAVFGLFEWEAMNKTVSGEKCLQHCPQPLLPAKTYPTAFFESIIVGRELLKENNYTAHKFWWAMVEWAGRATAPQDAFDAWYAAGLIPWIDYLNAPNTQLTLTLNKDAKVTEARRLCAESLSRRILKMPELLLTIDQIAQPTLVNIQKVLFGDIRAAFDVPQRLLMLTALDLTQITRNEWRLTDAGRKLLASNPPQSLPDFGEIESFQMDERDSDERDWQEHLDLLDFE